MSRPDDPKRAFYEATHDQLTGLVNSALLHDRLSSAVLQGVRDKRTFGVVVISLKQPLNDLAIREAAARIKSSTRDSDTVARTDWSKFTVLLSSVQDESGVLICLERIEAALKAPFAPDGKTVALETNTGLALFPEDGDSAERLIDRANRAMQISRKSDLE